MARQGISGCGALGAALAAVLWAGLVPARADEGIRAEYLCKGRFDATRVTAFFFNRDPSVVVLLVGETARRLPQARGASGARYASDEESFWIKGDSASWQLGQAPAYACDTVTSPASEGPGSHRRSGADLVETDHLTADRGCLPHWSSSS